MRRFLMGLLCAVAASAQSEIQVRNAASYFGKIAPGSIIEVNIGFGRALTSASRVGVASQSNGSSEGVDLEIVAVKSFAVWAVSPSNIRLGPTSITLTIDGKSATPMSVDIVRSAVGLFTVDSNGPAIAQNNDASAPPVVNRLATPALPGQFVTLWATGLGELTTADTIVEMAGIFVVPSFAGHAPGLPGVDQINFQVPSDAANDCYVPVTVHAGGRLSNQVTIAKADSLGSCSHPLGLSVDQLKALDSGEAIPLGSISIAGDITSGFPGIILPSPGYIRLESVLSQFWSWPAIFIYQFSQPQESDTHFFACTLSSVVGIVPGNLSFFPAGRLDDRLSFSGPADQQLQARGMGGQYIGIPALQSPMASPAQLQPEFFSAGTWTVTSAGDDTLAPFQRSFNLPPQVRWTNRESLSKIVRNNDITVVWDPSLYSSVDVMTVALIGGDEVAALCHVPASSGKALLSRALLLELSPAKDGFLTLQLSRRAADLPRIEIPLASGRSMPTIVSYQFRDILPVTIE